MVAICWITDWTLICAKCFLYTLLVCLKAAMTLLYCPYLSCINISHLWYGAFFFSLHRNSFKNGRIHTALFTTVGEILLDFLVFLTYIQALPSRPTSHLETWKFWKLMKKLDRLNQWICTIFLSLIIISFFLMWPRRDCDILMVSARQLARPSVIRSC